jgi:hypothetical protein
MTEAQPPVIFSYSAVRTLAVSSSLRDVQCPTGYIPGPVRSQVSDLQLCMHQMTAVNCRFCANSELHVFNFHTRSFLVWTAHVPATPKTQKSVHYNHLQLELNESAHPSCESEQFCVLSILGKWSARMAKVLGFDSMSLHKWVTSRKDLRTIVRF